MWNPNLRDGHRRKTGRCVRGERLQLLSHDYPALAKLVCRCPLLVIYRFLPFKFSPIAITYEVC